MYKMLKFKLFFAIFAHNCLVVYSIQFLYNHNYIWI